MTDLTVVLNPVWPDDRCMNQFADFSRPVTMSTGAQPTIVLVSDALDLAAADALRKALGPDIVLRYDPSGRSVADLLADAR